MGVLGSRAVWFTRRSLIRCLIGRIAACCPSATTRADRSICLPSAAEHRLWSPRLLSAAARREAEPSRACRRTPGFGQPGRRHAACASQSRVDAPSRVLAVKRRFVRGVGQAIPLPWRHSPILDMGPRRGARQAPLEVSDRTVLVRHRLLSEGRRGVHAQFITAGGFVVDASVRSRAGGARVGRRDTSRRARLSSRPARIRSALAERVADGHADHRF